MREVERPEVMVMHCDWCGCKNKLKYDYGVKGEEPKGFITRCCNCGRIEHFNRNFKAPLDIFTHKYQILDMRCIKEQECIHKDCPLYGTNPMKKRNKQKPLNVKMDKVKVETRTVLPPFYL